LKIQEIQLEKKVRITFLPFFKNNLSESQTLPIGGYTTMLSCSQLLGYFRLGPKSPNSSASVLKTSSHRRHHWKRAKHWFCWNTRKCWAKMLSQVLKMIMLWNFVT